jgi:hypothetical protein
MGAWSFTGCTVHRSALTTTGSLSDSNYRFAPPSDRALRPQVTVDNSVCSHPFVEKEVACLRFVLARSGGAKGTAMLSDQRSGTRQKQIALHLPAPQTLIQKRLIDTPSCSNRHHA